MKGDFTRNTFNPDKHFLRVLMQQGRVQLDSDWNEQAAILLHYMQMLATDIIGPYAGPAGENWGFQVSKGGNGDFLIGKGRYYVNGILCENAEDINYSSQLDYPLFGDDKVLEAGNYSVYLDVWERHVSFVEDDDIREKALNGPDTAMRSKVVWQVKVFPLTPQYAYCYQGSSLLTQDLLTLSKICMSARAKQGQPSTQPCLTEPESQYRGAENQLYRVEIHDGNIDETGQNIEGAKPTFKFSRENGSVVFPIISLALSSTPDDASHPTVTVELEHLGRDAKLALCVNDWVEYIDDNIDLRNKTQPLAQVLEIDTINRKVSLKVAVGTLVVASSGEGGSLSRGDHPYLRRWDQKKANKLNPDGVISITTGAWIPLEDGIEIKFSLYGKVRHGDYWLIPARNVTGDVEWPKQIDGQGNVIKDSENKPIPKALPPMGIEHYYAPLAIINVNSDGSVTQPSDCRCGFRPLSYSCQYNYFGRLGIGTHLICPQEIDAKQ